MTSAYARAVWRPRFCSPRHHRSYICRRLHPSPPSHARPRSGPSGLNTTKFLRSHPMSTGRGCPASRSSVEASNSKQGPYHLIVLVHGIMVSPSDWTYGEAVLKKRLEEMIHGLQRVGCKKVDVNFHASLWPYSAHNNMHVKNEWLHNAGAGVTAHVADSTKQTYLPSSL